MMDRACVVVVLLMAASTPPGWAQGGPDCVTMEGTATLDANFIGDSSPEELQRLGELIPMQVTYAISLDGNTPAETLTIFERNLEGYAPEARADAVQVFGPDGEVIFTASSYQLFVWPEGFWLDARWPGDSDAWFEITGLFEGGLFKVTPPTARGWVNLAGQAEAGITLGPMILGHSPPNVPFTSVEGPTESLEFVDCPVPPREPSVPEPTFETRSRPGIIPISSTKPKADYI